jgi:hypothetical protein
MYRKRMMRMARGERGRNWMRRPRLLQRRHVTPQPQAVFFIEALKSETSSSFSFFPSAC